MIKAIPQNNGYIPVMYNFMIKTIPQSNSYIPVYVQNNGYIGSIFLYDRMICLCEYKSRLLLCLSYFLCILAHIRGFTLLFIIRGTKLFLKHIFPGICILCYL